MNYENEQDVIAALNFLKRTDVRGVIENFKRRIKKAYREYKNPKSWIKENIELLTDELSEPHISKGEFDENLLVNDVINMTSNHFQQHMLYRRAEQKIKDSLDSKC